MIFHTFALCEENGKKEKKREERREEEREEGKEEESKGKERHMIGG